MLSCDRKPRHAALLGALLAGAMLVHSSAGNAVERNRREATTAAQRAASPARDYSDATLAKVVPGHTTKTEIEALLGKPWRETELDEEDMTYPGNPSVEVWEYRGRDAKGTYRVHIEFDRTGATTLIAKIPDKAARAIARVAAPAQNRKGQ